MMDIYPFAVAFYAILLIATIFSLKYTMKAIDYHQRNEKKSKNNSMSSKNYQDNNLKKQKSQTCRILKYLIRNFTIASIFGGRMETSIILILFTYCFVGLYVYFTTFWQVGLGFGSIISLTALISQIIQQRYMNIKESGQQQEAKNEKKWRLIKITYVVVSIITIIVYLALLGLSFKNYVNSKLSLMMINFAIVFSLDNFAIKPFLFLAISLMAHENRQIIRIIQRQEQKRQINLVRVGNDFERPQTKHHFVINLQVQPQPVDLTKSKVFTNKSKQLSKSNKSKQLSRSNRSKQLNQSRIFYNNALQALPSSSIINDNGQANNEGSLAQMVCHGQMNKSGIHKMTSMKELNQLELQKIQENPGAQLQHYFCINLRRSRQAQQIKNMQNKLQEILHSNPNIETSEFVKEFILQDFVCCSPKNIEQHNEPLKEQQEGRNRYSKSKGSLKGIKTFRIIQKEHNINLDDKENTIGQSTKNQISEAEVEGTPKNRFPSRGKNNRTHILKISERDTGQLQQIDINSPNKRGAGKAQYNTHVIPEEEVKIKNRRNRRRTTKQISQPYILQDKLIQAYFPGKNKTDLDNYIRSKKKNFDRSQFFNNSNKKEYSKGREKPIVHESEQHHTQFFIPKF